MSREDIAMVGTLMRRFIANQSGTTAIEYAIIAAGIAGAIVATLTTLGTSVVTMWKSVKAALG